MVLSGLGIHSQKTGSWDINNWRKTIFSELRIKYVSAVSIPLPREADCLCFCDTHSLFFFFISLCKNIYTRLWIKVKKFYIFCRIHDFQQNAVKIYHMNQDWKKGNKNIFTKGRLSRSMKTISLIYIFPRAIVTTNSAFSLKLLSQPSNIYLN